MSKVFVVMLSILALGRPQSCGPLPDLERLLSTANTKWTTPGTDLTVVPPEIEDAAKLLLASVPKQDQPLVASCVVRRLFPHPWVKDGRSVSALLAFGQAAGSASAVAAVWQELRAAAILDTKPYLAFSVHEVLRHMLRCCVHAMVDAEQDALLTLLANVGAERARLLDLLVADLQRQHDGGVTNQTLLVAKQIGRSQEAVDMIINRLVPQIKSGAVSVTRLSSLLLHRFEIYCQSALTLHSALGADASVCQRVAMRLSTLDALPYVKEHASAQHFGTHCVPLADAVARAYDDVRASASAETMGACLRGAWLEAVRLSLADAVDTAYPPALKALVLAQRQLSVDATTLAFFRSLGVTRCARLAVDAQATRELGLQNGAASLVRLVQGKAILANPEGAAEDCDRVVSEAPSWARRLAEQRCFLEGALRLTLDARGVARFTNADGLHLQLRRPEQAELSTLRNSPEQLWYLQPSEDPQLFELFVYVNDKVINLHRLPFHLGVGNRTHWRILCT
ncbi:uncharacterized protein LOC132195710 [Neocloeon triangulifer]|uniref:uncharacterized protein LOC132195710 n=1 Tax=Neocloeon triangulifer TaxID=2078957 RepID=UPI00286FA232|nr:uncharacterized protein LOC132195710 [Neocloeon triangulifer]